MKFLWMLAATIVTICGGAAAAQTNVPATQSVLVRPVQPQLVAPSQAPSSQAGSVAGGMANMPIEDAVMLTFMLTAADAKNDLRSMLAEMDATRRQREALRERAVRTRTRTAELRAATTPNSGLQLRTPTTADVQPDPCATSTIEAWRVCAGQIEARLTSAQIPADDRRRLEPMLASLRAELNAISGDDRVSRQHFDRSRQLATDIANDLEAVAARHP